MYKRIVAIIFFSFVSIHIEAGEHFATLINSKIKDNLGYSQLSSAQQRIIDYQLPTPAELVSLQELCSPRSTTADRHTDAFCQRKINAIKMTLAVSLHN